MKAKLFLALIGLELTILLVLQAASFLSSQGKINERLAQRTLVKELQLTDLALWSETRYTRHPSQADGFAPFQDTPGTLEHFPTGSFSSPLPPRTPDILNNK